MADTGNYRIQKFTPDGQYLTHWGEQGIGDEQFGVLWGIATDTENNAIFVVDPDNRCIKKFSPEGGFTG